MPEGKSNYVALSQELAEQLGEVGEVEVMVAGRIENVEGVPYLVVTQVEGEDVGSEQTENQRELAKLEGRMKGMKMSNNTSASYEDEGEGE